MANKELIQAGAIVLWHIFLYGVNEVANPPEVDEDVCPHAIPKYEKIVEGVINEEDRIELIKNALLRSHKAGLIAAQMAQGLNSKITIAIFDEAHEQAA